MKIKNLKNSFGDEFWIECPFYLRNQKFKNIDCFIDKLVKHDYYKELTFKEWLGHALWYEYNKRKYKKIRDQRFWLVYMSWSGNPRFWAKVEREWGKARKERQWKYQ